MTFCLQFSATHAAEEPQTQLIWEELPALPSELGVAGPFVGVSNDALIVAGGANFARPVWESEKQWHDAIFVLARSGDRLHWIDGGRLPRPIGYGATVSTPEGVVCIGGNDAQQTFAEVFLLRWEAAKQKIARVELPSLPRPCANGQAALVDNVIYLAGGQSGAELSTAMSNLWSLDLAQRRNADFAWRELKAWPGPARAFNITVAQHDGRNAHVYVVSGRRAVDDKIEMLKDVWQYTPKTSTWQRRADAPRSVMAGTAVAFGQSDIFVFSGDDGSLFASANELRDRHPGFLKAALIYETLADKWTSGGPLPQVQVATPAVMWNGRAIVASGEIRPRVRTPKIWSYAPRAK
jgi:N-acetylneuraminic acid mutarotase